MKHRRCLRTLAASLGLLALLVTAPPSFGDQSDPIAGRQDPAVVNRWKRDLERIDQLLVGGKFGKAYKAADRLLSTMTSRIVHGEGAFPLMAAASILRAVAESGRGNAADALWDLHLAQAFRAQVESFDFSRYGEAGAPLAAARLGRPRAGSKSLAEIRLKPPERLHTVTPDYPDAMRTACVQGLVITSLILDRRGRPHNPQVLHSDGGPVMAYAALEALRQWRFEPARLDGVPIDVYFNLTVNFRVSGCPSSS